MEEFCEGGFFVVAEAVEKIIFPAVEVDPVEELEDGEEFVKGLGV
jgi:hypothetical protein